MRKRPDPAGWLHWLLIVPLCQFGLFQSGRAAAIDGGGGTLVAIVFSKSFVIIGADSRNTNLGNKRMRDRCKIEPLGRHRFFAATGVTDLTYIGDPVQSIDAFGTAKAGYRPDFGLDYLTRLWGRDMSAALNRMVLRAGSLPPHGRVIVQGFFGGIDLDGKTHLDLSRIGALPERPFGREIFREKGRRLSPARSGGRPWVFGAEHPNLVAEFLRGRSVRARRARQRMQQAIAHRRLDAVDAEALLVQSVIEFVIKWANDNTVGGDVSVLIAQPGHADRWFSRAAACAG